MKEKEKKEANTSKPNRKIISSNVRIIFFEIDVNTHINIVALFLGGGFDVYTWYVCRIVVEWKH